MKGLKQLVLAALTISMIGVVVWTTTRTQTVMKGKSADDTPFKHYSEMWFLINKDNTGWKIAGTASNRPTDSIEIG